MTFGEFADKVREIHEGNERDFGPMEVKVAVGCFEIPFHDIVFKRGEVRPLRRDFREKGVA